MGGGEKKVMADGRLGCGSDEQEEKQLCREAGEIKKRTNAMGRDDA